MADNHCLAKHTWVIGIVFAIISLLAGVVFAMVRDYDVRLRGVENTSAIVIERLDGVQASLRRIETEQQRQTRSARGATGDVVVEK